MRWNPFATRREHAALLRRIEQLEAQLVSLEGATMKHEALTAQQFHEIKYGKPKVFSTGNSTLTKEQEENLRKFIGNSKLYPENKYSGGYVGRGPEGLFGEVTSEQTRPAAQINPAVYAYDPDAPTTSVDVTIQANGDSPPDLTYEDLRRKIAAMPLVKKFRRNDHLDLPPAGLEEVSLTIEGMIREEDAERDREAWEQAELNQMDDTNPKE